VGTLIVVIFLVLAGGIAFFVAHKISDARSTINSAISATSSPPKSTSRSPAPSTTRMRTPTPSASPTAPSTSPAPPPGGSLTISGIGENKTIACNDNVVTVSGISNTVVITGHCTSLTVSGMQNTITVDAADSIEASGFNNKVTYHTGAPKISNFGGSNVVQQG
jgi:cytoskeletal protein RodZ